MQLDPLPEMVLVTIFMEGLRTGVVRTEVFRVRPTSFEAAVGIALIAAFNLKAARLSTHGYNPTWRTPIIRLIRRSLWTCLAEKDEKAELQAIEQYCNIQRCFMCENTKHLLSNCRLRRARQASSKRTPAANQKSGMVRQNVYS